MAVNSNISEMEQKDKVVQLSAEIEFTKEVSTLLRILRQLTHCTRICTDQRYCK
jgi:hypothetical protein